jgi:hypothetical protein
MKREVVQLDEVPACELIGVVQAILDYAGLEVERCSGFGLDHEYVVRRRELKDLIEEGRDEL